MNDSHAMALSKDQLIYAITVCLHDSHGMALYIYFCIGVYLKNFGAVCCMYFEGWVLGIMAKCLLRRLWI